MERFKSLNECFPDHALVIRRRQRDDPTFRELCDDFEEANRASIYWRSAPNQSEERANQYRELVTELEAEIENLLHLKTR